MTQVATYTLSNSQQVVKKLKEGRVTDVKLTELTHPRLVHFYNQEQFLYSKLGDGQYEDLIKKLRRISSNIGLEANLSDFETNYRDSLVKAGYDLGHAAQEARDTTKMARKIWHRMRTDFDTIEELYKQRIAYINSLGEYLHGNRKIRELIDLMLIIKDLAMRTDGWGSDMDLALSLDVENNQVAHTIAINAVEPAIKDYQLKTASLHPRVTAHIDWLNQVYATRWLSSVAAEPPTLEPIFNGFETNTRTRKFVAENIFGFRFGVPLSIPIYPITKKSIYERLMKEFTQ